MTQKLVDSASGALARGTSRKGFLIRAAAVGSAIAVAPIRFLIYPDVAEAITPGQCSSGTRCRDGWTEFCCSTNSGVNDCPSYAFFGGWWKCSSYSGNHLCTTYNVRYYVDCNRRPSSSCSCHCARNTCSCRRSCCNVFRYGNCHTEITQETPVVCRTILCQNPGSLYSVCNYGGVIENATCGHEACCHCGTCG